MRRQLSKQNKFSFFLCYFRKTIDWCRNSHLWCSSNTCLNNIFGLIPTFSPVEGVSTRHEQGKCTKVIALIGVLRSYSMQVDVVRCYCKNCVSKSKGFENRCKKPKDSKWNWPLLNPLDVPRKNNLQHVVLLNHPSLKLRNSKRFLKRTNDESTLPTLYISSYYKFKSNRPCFS